MTQSVKGTCLKSLTTGNPQNLHDRGRPTDSGKSSFYLGMHHSSYLYYIHTYIHKCEKRQPSPQNLPNRTPTKLQLILQINRYGDTFL